MSRKQRGSHSGGSAGPPDEAASAPRIIGGELRGRKLPFHPDPRTRPMKDRTREAVFNLLGPAVRGKHAIDLFAGTGALGFEALSRGAASATFAERHFPTAAQIERTGEALGVSDRCRIVAGNTLLWSKRLPDLPPMPWVVFCSPPYDLYVQQTAEMAALLAALWDRAAPDSVFVVEADERFDFAALPCASLWDVRDYPPARVGLLSRPAD